MGETVTVRLPGGTEPNFTIADAADGIFPLERSRYLKGFR